MFCGRKSLETIPVLGSLPSHYSCRRSDFPLNFSIKAYPDDCFHQVYEFSKNDIRNDIRYFVLYFGYVFLLLLLSNSRYCELFQIWYIATPKMPQSCWRLCKSYWKFSPFYWVRLLRLSLKILIANFTKWLNTLKQFVGKLASNCLSVLAFLWDWRIKG